MINHLLKSALSAVAGSLLENYRHASIRLLKIEATKAYVHGVRIVRLSALGLMGLGLVIGLICVGALLFHVGLFILLPWTVKAKALFGMILGAVYVITGGAALYAALDEKTWMQKSGAVKMLDEATRPRKG